MRWTGTENSHDLHFDDFPGVAREGGEETKRTGVRTPLAAPNGPYLAEQVWQKLDAVLQRAVLR